MSVPAGHIELDRTVESIRVGARHRKDMGDLDALIASIDRDGLLQPITVTPNGALVCGARRLAAIQRLGWRTVSVWVRSSISDRLGHLLAEQDDNQLHKSLSPLEAAELYREIKQLMAEDATRRDAATQFSSEHQPRWNGGGNFPPPLTPTGKTREQAAGMIPDAPSYKTLDKIAYLQQLATDAAVPELLKDDARNGLAKIDAGAAVDPIYQRIRDAHRQIETDRDRELHALANQALDRLHRDKATKRKQNRRPRTTSADSTGTARYPVRAFVLTWDDLIAWWTHYDADELAGQLTDEQAESFFATVEGTVQFAAQLRTARHHSVDAPGEDDERPRLRAL